MIKKSSVYVCSRKRLTVIPSFCRKSLRSNCDYMYIAKDKVRGGHIFDVYVHNKS